MGGPKASRKHPALINCMVKEVAMSSRSKTLSASIIISLLL
jgi:hypothetical protein